MVSSWEYWTEYCSELDLAETMDPVMDQRLVHYFHWACWMVTRSGLALPIETVENSALMMGRRLVRCFDWACWMVTRSATLMAHLRVPDLALSTEHSKGPGSASSIEKVENLASNSASNSASMMDRSSASY